MGIVNIFVFHAIWVHLQPDFNTDIQALRKLFWQEGHHPPFPAPSPKVPLHVCQVEKVRWNSP